MATPHDPLQRLVSDARREQRRAHRRKRQARMSFWVQLLVAAVACGALWFWFDHGYQWVEPQPPAGGGTSQWANYLRDKCAWDNPPEGSFEAVACDLMLTR